MTNTFKIILTIFLISMSSVGLRGQDSLLTTTMDTTNTIFLVSHGWHTGIVIVQNDIADSSLLRLKRIPQTKYLEFGWGDRKFYQTEEYAFFLTVRAAFWPTQSVVHVVGFNPEVVRYFSLSDIVELKVNSHNFKRLLNYIRDAFAKTEAGNIIPVGKGLYGDSHFFQGRHSYYFPYTCNTWVAAALKEAGFPLAPLTYQRASQLMKRMHKYGIRLNSAGTKKDR